MRFLREGVKNLGYEWSGELEEAFRTYMEELKRWNERMNLTSITDDREIEIKHFLDSVQILRVVKGGLLIDIGPGGGFPSIPAKLVDSSIEVVLLEGSQKKVLFLQHLVSVLGIKGVKVINGRAEDKNVKERLKESGDYVVGRAVAKPPRFLKFARPLVKRNGKVLYMLGPNQNAEELKKKGEKYSIDEEEIYFYELPEGAGKRAIWVGKRNEGSDS